MHMTAANLIARMEKNLGWVRLGSGYAYAGMYRHDCHGVSSGGDLPLTWVP